MAYITRKCEREKCQIHCCHCCISLLFLYDVLHFVYLILSLDLFLSLLLLLWAGLFLQPQCLYLQSSWQISFSDVPVMILFLPLRATRIKMRHSSLMLKVLCDLVPVLFLTFSFPFYPVQTFGSVHSVLLPFLLSLHIPSV